MSTPGENEMGIELLDRFEREVRRDGRYAPEAFEFLHRGLEFATEHRYRDSKGSGLRHVTGQELCGALRELARQRWGPLVREVLRSWNIHRTRDFGEMVFFMIELGLMGKQDSDNITDFDDVYSFNEAFGSYTLEFDTSDT